MLHWLVRISIGIDLWKYGARIRRLTIRAHITAKRNGNLGVSLSLRGSNNMAVHITQKEDGTFWEVLYEGGTIKWNQLLGGSAGFGPSGDPSQTPPLPRILGPSPLNVLFSVAEVGTSLWQTWELSQHRKFVETNQELSQRIEWLTVMMGRWASVHRGGGGFDLRSSAFLVREVNALLDVLASNKKASLPQSLLYDLDLIRDSFRSMRLLLVNQFRALFDSQEIQIKKLVQEALPSHSLNIGFIEQLFDEPNIDSVGNAKSKSTSSFEKVLLRSIRSEDDFKASLFPSNEIEVHEFVGEISGEAGTPTRLMKQISEMLSGSLLWPRGEESKNELGDRAYDFQELILLSSEFRRVRALNDAWLAVTLIATEKLNDPIGIIVTDMGVAVGQGIRNRFTASTADALGLHVEQQELQNRNPSISDRHH